MTLLVPLLLVAVGSAGLVVLREWRATLAAFAVQWLGTAWAIALLTNTADAALILGVTTQSAVEIVTAVVCIAVLIITMRSIGRETSPNGSGLAAQELLADYLLPGAAVLLAGIAGTGFARLFPLGEDPTGDLIFYWLLMSGALTLVLEGARYPLKLTAGLLVLLNAVALLIYTISPAAPTTAILALFSFARLALTTILAYGGLLLVAIFKDFSLDPLFTSRDVQPHSLGMAIISVADENPGDSEIVIEGSDTFTDDAIEDPEIEVETEDDG